MKHLPFLLFATFVLSCEDRVDKSVEFPEGGYPYPINLDSSDKVTYIYPIKDLLSRKDSLEFTSYTEYLFKSFEEPNLSIIPSEQVVFRLIYQPASTRYTAIVTLKQDKITVKELETGYASPYIDQEQLDSIEKGHFLLFESFFPIDDYKGDEHRKRHFDSITKVYPQLRSVDYYKQLNTKANSFGPEPFTYKQREIPITKDKYKYFVDLINQSGYWAMKPINLDCLGEYNHQSGYILEAATSVRYNYASFIDCINPSQLEKVCIDLIKYSKVDENEKKWHSELRKTIK